MAFFANFFIGQFGADFVRMDGRHYNSVTLKIISGAVPGVPNLVGFQVEPS